MALAICLLIGMAIYFQVKKGVAIGITYPILSSLGIFIIGAIEEEIIFRGYIQTRLTGIIRQDMLCAFYTALLFLAMHYPIQCHSLPYQNLLCRSSAFSKDTYP